MPDQLDQRINLGNTFTRELLKIIRYVECVIGKHPDIDQVKRLITLAKGESPILILEESRSSILAFSKYIIDEDETYFVNTMASNPKSLMNNTNSRLDKPEEQMFNSLVDIFNKRFSSFKSGEKKMIWQCLSKMLECVTQDALITKSYN